MAEDIFEKPEAASAWLSCGHPMLEGKAPLDWAKSAYGTERVKEILIALKHGGAV
ncbi:antitoxin Xre/MbcA/ParS toxin-binding domain-containing protein [Hydrogenophaga defluvii]|uniref:Antitoxin Xre/MbcA/ParS toxin-binding domain-containing protein n=1 Tax=Hydrogenophaga defluvii TaxID=249410 RepID=A0ABW2S7I3_9BURK